MFSLQQVEELCELLYGHDVDYVAWRHFLVCVGHPSPLPDSSQLVAALRRFSTLGSEGKVTWEQYQAVGAWFAEGESTSSDQFNRNEELRKVCLPLTSLLNATETQINVCVRKPCFALGIF